MLRLQLELCDLTDSQPVFSKFQLGQFDFIAPLTPAQALAQSDFRVLDPSSGCYQYATHGGSDTPPGLKPCPPDHCRVKNLNGNMRDIPLASQRLMLADQPDGLLFPSIIDDVSSFRRCRCSGRLLA